MSITLPDRGQFSNGPEMEAIAASSVHFEHADGVPVTGLTGVVIGTATSDITVTWPNGGFTDTNYVIVKPQVTLNAIAIAANVQAVVKSRTTTACVVTVTTNATLALGNATLSVDAYKQGN